MLIFADSGVGFLVGTCGLSFSRDDFYKKELSFSVSSSYGPGRYDKIMKTSGGITLLALFDGQPRETLRR